MSCALKTLFQISCRFLYPRYDEVKRYACGKSIHPIKIAPIPHIKKFIVDCMEAVCTPLEHAEIFADSLIAADSRGIFSHGLNRLQMYINDVKSGLCVANAVPIIEKESPSTALVCGRNGLGAVIGHFCMNLAMEKAENEGIGLVTCNDSNHFGAGIYHVMEPIEKGLIGFAVTNTSPLVVPTGAKESVLGTNPITLGAPGVKDDYVTIDVSTSTVSVGKIEILKRKGEAIPTGWAFDNQGKMTTDATEALKANKLVPLGGFSGYGLSFAVELLSGILGGAEYGHKIRSWGDFSKPANNGHCFIAVDPKHFEDGFRTRLSDIMEYLTCMEPFDPNRPVVYPGQIEKEILEKTKKQGGVIYLQNLLDTSDQLAKDLGVAPLELIKGERC